MSIIVAAPTKTIQERIEVVIFESYNKAKEKKFQDVNFVFPKNQSVIHFLKSKLKIFITLDIYSQTFLSIHTRAKVALVEFQTNKFHGEHYLELLRLVLTLPEELRYGKFKSKGTREKEEKKLEKENLNEEITLSEEGKQVKEFKRLLLSRASDETKNNARIVKEGKTGKQISKYKQKDELRIEELSLIDFEDEEFNYKTNEDLDELKL